MFMSLLQETLLSLLIFGRTESFVVDVCKIPVTAHVLFPLYPPLNKVYHLPSFKHNVCRVSVVSIAASYGLEVPGIESR